MLRPFLVPGSDLGAFLAEETGRGLRVLLLAYSPEPVPLQQFEGEAHLPHGLIPLGAISLRDTLRPEARETLAQFVALGVQIKIISGDHPRTVAALAMQVGLDEHSKTVTGTELDALDEVQLASVVEETTIFGRITPGQKERIVQALRRRSHYVAMIGDGVNDLIVLAVPSLRMLFNLEALNTLSYAIILGAGLAPMAGLAFSRVRACVPGTCSF